MCCCRPFKRLLGAVIAPPPTPPQPTTVCNNEIELVAITKGDRRLQGAVNEPPASMTDPADRLDYMWGIRTKEHYVVWRQDYSFEFRNNNDCPVTLQLPDTPLVHDYTGDNPPVITYKTGTAKQFTVAPKSTSRIEVTYFIEHSKAMANHTNETVGPVRSYPNLQNWKISTTGTAVDYALTAFPNYPDYNGGTIATTTTDANYLLSVFTYNSNSDPMSGQVEVPVDIHYNGNTGSDGKRNTVAPVYTLLIQPANNTVRNYISNFNLTGNGVTKVSEFEYEYRPGTILSDRSFTDALNITYDFDRTGAGNALRGRPIEGMFTFKMVNKTTSDNYTPTGVMRIYLRKDFDSFTVSYIPPP